MSDTDVWFKDVTKDVVAEFVNEPDHVNPYHMPNSVGSGVGVLDVNKDGLMDLYFLRMTVSQDSPGNCLYVQQANGGFVDKTAEYQLGLRGYFHGVGVGDLNNDGWDDLVLTEYQGIRVFRNRDGKTFEDVTAQSGLVNSAWGMSVSIADYDADGWLDIVVANYVHYDPSKKCRSPRGDSEFCGPQQFSGSASKLFRNLGGSGEVTTFQFQDVSVQSGLAAKPGPGLGVVCLDFSGDGLVDLFFADDMQPNRLFVNQGDGTFKEEAGLRGIAVDGIGQAKADMGIGIADVDRNGLLDVFITHLKTENHTLWTQGPAGIYTDRTLVTGLLTRQWKGTAFGTILADFDTDGWADLVMVNGAIRRNDFQDRTFRDEVRDFWKPYAQRAQAYRNDGDGRFVEISSMNPDLSDKGDVGRGLAAVDLDNDGALDLVMTPIGSPVRVFQNVASKRGNWVGISAVLPDQGGRTALGSIVDVIVKGQVFRSVVHSGYSYLCANDPRVIVGLGSATEYDDIQVIWPGRERESFGAGKANGYVQLQKGSGQIQK
ncbi:MAG: CRTAC1 family protein [Verrucomicrobia bacterium]|nr:CRTAC1 family protein [Verrucomicrobiota bacterium]